MQTLHDVSKQQVSMYLDDLDSDLTDLGRDLSDVSDLDGDLSDLSDLGRDLSDL